MFQLSQGLRRICSSLFVVSFCCKNFARSLVVNHKHRQQLSPLSLRAKFGSKLMSSKSSNNMVKIIDSHVHVWSDGVMPFGYSGIDAAPPSDLRSQSSASSLQALMEKSNVKGAVIIQPINYKYDHSYLISVMEDERYKHLFKFVSLFNPTFDTITEGEAYLEDLYSKGFKGVRWNPYLFPKGESMSGPKGLAWFAKAGTLKMPVGIMCFKGLPLHYTDIVAILEHSPSTDVIIDHFGFFLQGGLIDETAWEQLLSLAAYPQVNVKLSALFRVSLLPWPHADLVPRVSKLVEKFGVDRLLFGTDFPFVQQQPVVRAAADQSTSAEEGIIPGKDAEEPYTSYVRAPFQWCDESNLLTLSDEQWNAIMSGTAERLYGKFE